MSNILKRLKLLKKFDLKEVTKLAPNDLIFVNGTPHVELIVGIQKIDNKHENEKTWVNYDYRVYTVFGSNPAEIAKIPYNCGECFYVVKKR